MVIMLDGDGDGDDDHKSDADFSLDQLFSAQPSQPNPIQSLLIDAQLNHPNSFCLSSVFFPIQSVKIEKNKCAACTLACWSN